MKIRTLTRSTLLAALAVTLSAPAAMAQSYASFDLAQNLDGTETCNSRRIPAIRTVGGFAINTFPGGPPPEAVDLFNPAGPRDVILSMSNEGPDPAEVRIYTEGSSTPTIRTIAAGLSVTIMEADVVDLEGMCVPFNCKTEFALHSAEANGPADGIDDIASWYFPPPVSGSADLPPDSSPAVCLWESDTIWETDMNAHDVNVEVTATGVQNLDVTVWHGAVSQTVSLQSENEFPNKNWMSQEYDDVTKVDVICEKSPIASCDNCTYDYKITFLD